ncbi:DUF3846 domain-containing protein [Hydrogenoanaerobacterium saccharovorans]|uniref:DUF3846 domain-containing protein n=1 Tax=Hydrogenoanaerobacterium saccharovorans TaxID=474960 RepID=UPI003BFA739F
MGSSVSDNKIRVLVVEPKKEPYVREISKGYKALQEIIQGTFTVTELAAGVDIISADEYPAEPTINRIVKGFPFYETFVVAGVDKTTGKTISLSEENISKYQEQFKAPTYEIPKAVEQKTTKSHHEIVESVLLRGANVEESQKRIYTFFRNNSNKKERIKFLKKEYGWSGSASPLDNGGHIQINYNSKGAVIDYQDDNLQFVDKFTWAQMENGIDALIQQEKYPVPDDWVEPEVDIPQYKSKPFKVDSSLPEDTEYEQMSLFATQEYEEEVEEPIQENRTAEPALLGKAEPKVPEAEQPSVADKEITETPHYKVGDYAELDYSGTSIKGEIKYVGDKDVSVFTGPYSWDVQVINRKYFEKHLRSNPNNEQLHYTLQNYQFPADLALPNGQKAKYQCNISAIKLLKQLEADGAQATAEQQDVLAHYVGWGGIAQAFDESNTTWSIEYKELKSVFTEDEYESARASVNNAHFTSPLVIRAIYNALEKFGFRGGNMLDPGLGIGNFYGALPERLQDSGTYGVEIDSITGRIAKQLYPNSNIQINGFENTEFPDNFFDVCNGNVPFGSYSVFDPRYNKLNLNIHDYFFAKSLDIIRPNGIISYITSKGTLDKASPTFRKYLAQRAELIGAIRLPNTAFKQNAGTEVTSDIIFLKKRERMSVEEPDWVHLGLTEDGIPVNQYFAQNPHMMLGKMVYDTMYGGEDRKETALHADERDLETALQEAVSFLPSDIYEQQKNIQEVESEDVLLASPDVKNFTYTKADNGSIYYRENSVMIKQEFSYANQRLLSDFCELKGCIRYLLNIQMDGCSDEELAQAQKELNQLYDDFVSKHGYVTKKSNYNALQKDTDYFLISSLENVNEDTGEVTKRDIFTKRTITPKRVTNSTETAKDALAVSLSQKGKIDFNYMQQLYKKPLPEIIEELGALIYLNPVHYNEENPTDGYETESEYLSGNVREKLRTAKQAAEQHPELFLKNVEALEKVQPKDILPDEIEIHLGSNFIPLEYYSQFIYDTLNPTAAHRGEDAKRHIFVRYNRFNNSYFITNKALEYKSVLAKDTYGSERMSAYHIIEASLNLQSAVVKDDISEPGEKPRYVINHTETTVAKQKQELLQDTFKEWLFRDVERREKIVRMYNEKYNSIRLREYDGSLLSHIDGLNPEWKLRPKQADAVARGIFSGRNALYAHCVGAGKTLTCVTVAMERKRLGLSNKTMIVVPNTLTDQWKSSFLEYFPGANILVSTKKDFEKNNRRKFISKIATGNYDAVILGFSQFERIPVSDTLMSRELRNQIEDITECIKELKEENSEKWTVKQAEAEKKRLENQLKKLMSGRKDSTITFEELGVDSLIVDEAHNYKNCAIFTKLRNVAGLSTAGAQKSTDLLLKIRYLNELNQGKGCVYFATGTPLSNSMTEMFTMERYLMNDVLENMGFDYFDNWVSVFGETVTSMELKPEGTGYRPRTRLSKFVNLPELVTSFRLVADIQTADMLNLPKPKLVDGKPQIVVAPPSKPLELFLHNAAKRAEDIRSGAVEPYVDNMLKLTGDARRAGTDIRLIDPNAVDDPHSKVNQCVQKVYDIYQSSNDFKGVQLVFCDISTPNPNKFNVYDDMRQKWIEMGIPAKEIAFIHNANNEIQLAKLFSQLRMGQVRILIGSSAKCGAGMNVQDRLIALHHLDSPWTPKDIEQREGRILRPGNNCKEVYIFRYVTEKSFDSYMWSILENKQRFISQIMTSKELPRICEDIDESVLSYAEVKAIANGNPKIKEKMEVEVELAKLKVLKNEYSKKRFRLQDEYEVKYPRSIDQNNTSIKKYEQDIVLRNENTKEDFNILLDGVVFTDKEQAGETIIAMSQKLKKLQNLSIGSYRGFSLELTMDYWLVCYVRICGAENYRVLLSDKSAGVIQRLDNALNSFEKQVSKLEFENAQNEEYILQSKAEYEKPFEHEDKLQALMQKQVELEKELQFDEKTKDEIPSREDDDIELIDALDDELEDDFELEE